MSTSQPAPTNMLKQTLHTMGMILGGCALAAVAIFLIGERAFDGPVAWFTRLVALSLLILGVVGWRLRLKTIYLAGEEDEWFVLHGWDGRTIGFVKSGMRHITPIQSTAPWRRVQPLFIKHTVTAQNQMLDSFEVHMRVRLEVFPDGVRSVEARWLFDNYPQAIETTARSLLADTATTELRKIDSFSGTIEYETENIIREAINSKFAFMQNYGIYVDEAATFADIMVSAEVLQQRIQARAELSTLQIIRDVAHDLGISTDELLIQRALENLPNMRSRQNIGEIAAVLQALRTQTLQSPPLLEEVIVPATESSPTTYVEGEYYDPNDPDAEDDDSRPIYSPF